jgi:hypothetical protein
VKATDTDLENQFGKKNPNLEDVQPAGLTATQSSLLKKKYQYRLSISKQKKPPHLR